MTVEPQLDAIDRRLLNDFQHGLPVAERPYAHIARELDIGEDEVIERLQRLQKEQLVSRVGPVFRPNRIGVSTLAAMAVPPERLESVATRISQQPEVNHNYEREHRYNLWFVVTADDRRHLNRVLTSIEQDTGLPILDLPMLEDYFIDLGFRIQWT